MGATLSDSTLFCEIGDPTKWEANLLIEQDDIEFVQAEQPIKVKLDEFPDRTYRSQITEIAKVDLKVTPRNLSNKSGGEVITKTDEAGSERPQNTSYEARAPIDDPQGLLTVGPERPGQDQHPLAIARPARLALSDADVQLQVVVRLRGRGKLRRRTSDGPSNTLGTECRRRVFFYSLGVGNEKTNLDDNINGDQAAISLNDSRMSAWK